MTNISDNDEFYFVHSYHVLSNTDEVLNTTNYDYNFVSALEKKNISTAVINMHTIKPIDKEAILQASIKSKLIVTVEEHNIIGGLGSAVSEILSSARNSCKLLSLGVNDTYTKSGSYKYLKSYYRLVPEKILEDINKSLND